MESQLSEIQSDIKEMLQAQARMEERMKAHAAEVSQNKEDTKADIIAIRADLKPVLMVYTSIKWLIGIAIMMTPFVTKFIQDN
jgi:hypothetical protein